MAKTKKTAEAGSNGERKPRRATTPRRRKTAGESAAQAPAGLNTAAPDDSSVSLPEATAVRAGAPASSGGMKPGVVSPGGTLFEAQRAAAAPVPQPPAVRTEDIARRAYEIFCERGGTHGYHMEDWLKAERELLRRRA